jgi:hypothetical protein
MASSGIGGGLIPQPTLPVVNPEKDLEPTKPLDSKVDEVLQQQIREQNLQGKHYKTPPALTDSQVEEAKTALVNRDYLKFSFPRQIRMRVDPAIPGQTYVAVSFYANKDATPDKFGRFGTLKVRGVYSDPAECEDRIADLLKRVDSWSSYFIAFVGKELPICANMLEYTKTVREIDIRGQNDKIARDYLKDKMDEEAQEKKEVEDREQKLRQESEVAMKHETEAKKDPVETYTELKVKRAVLKMRIYQLDREKRLQEEETKKLTNTLAKMEADIADPTLNLERVSKERYKKSAEDSGTNIEELLKFF